VGSSYERDIPAGSTVSEVMQQMDLLVVNTKLFLYILLIAALLQYINGDYSSLDLVAPHVQEHLFREKPPLTRILQ